MQRVQQVIGKKFLDRRGSVSCFGSFPAGLNLPTADMDLVWASESFRSGDQASAIPGKSQMVALAKKFQKQRLCDSFVVIAKAKVPIIKWIDKPTGLPVDISFENLSGEAAQVTLREWTSKFPNMHYLVALVKQFLLMRRDMNEVQHGGLGGFSIICLVVSFYQHNSTGENLGEIFLRFLDYYGNKFDLRHRRIVMDPPAILLKVSCNAILDACLTYIRKKLVSMAGKNFRIAYLSRIPTGSITTCPVVPTRSKTYSNAFPKLIGCCWSE